MGALGNDTKKSSAFASAAPTSESQMPDLGDIGNAVHVPRFMPENMLDMSICRSEEDLGKTKQALAEFRKIVNWTKQKFKAQETAADFALELAKSQNALVSHFAKTVIKQAESDSELAALLGALPQMIAAVQGTTATKKETKLKNFTDRLSAAAAGKSKKK